MSYIDGFVIAAPKTSREKFTQHAETADAVCMEWGATRVLECWEDDVPDGTVTDVRRGVQAKDDEAVVLSWVEWPDKEARDAGMKKMMEAMETDARVNVENNRMPLDGQRVQFGRIEPVAAVGE